MTYIFYDVKWL